MICMPTNPILNGPKAIGVDLKAHPHGNEFRNGSRHGIPRLGRSFAFPFPIVSPPSPRSLSFVKYKRSHLKSLCKPKHLPNAWLNREKEKKRNDTPNRPAQLVRETTKGVRRVRFRLEGKDGKKQQMDGTIYGKKKEKRNTHQSANRQFMREGWHSA